MQQLSVEELASWLAQSERPAPMLLDVREPWEFALCKLPGSVSMPMNSIPQRLAELERTETIVCICHHGMRSLQVARFLEQNGFTDITNLHGGVHAWAQQVDAAMPQY